LNSQNSVLFKQATNNPNRLNQSQGNLQVQQERLLRLQKPLAIPNLPPIDINSTPDGRAKNRRIKIILSPKLDEMYKLLSAA